MNICVSIYIYINASWKPFMCVKIWRETIDAILWNLLLLCKLKLMHHKNCFALCVSVYMYKYLYICVCLYFCVWEKLIRHETILIYIYIYIYIYIEAKKKTTIGQTNIDRYHKHVRSTTMCITVTTRIILQRRCQTHKNRIF